MTDHDNPYSAGIYGNDPREARREASLERLKAALAAVDQYADCGDNSCRFAGAQRRRGLGSNGGCTCVDRGRPFVVAALAALVRAARAATSAEPAEPVVSERRAPVQPVYKGGRVVGTVSLDEHERALQEYTKRHRRLEYEEIADLLGHEPKTWRPL